MERIQELTKETTLSTETSDGDLGPVISLAQKQKILKMLGESGESDNLYIQPKVIMDPDESSSLMTEEIFGPIFSVHTVKDQWEAVEKSNALDFGLNASIFTRDLRKARKMASEIRAGNICINDVLTNYLTVSLPFGGVGMSGLGRLQGKEGIRSFAFIQSVLEDRLGLKKEPWWFPVSPIIKKLFRRFIDFYYG